ncbi:MAG: hypothetical protein HC900_03595 [Methylacidiphilales bacterium]|nr:hypothetical protein [Candidatus Methylacidiphilales bacterium]
MLLPLTIFLAEGLLDYRQTREQARNDVLTRTEALADHATAILRTIRVVMARVEDRVGGQPWEVLRDSADLRDVLRAASADIPEIASVFLTEPDGRRITADGVISAVPAADLHTADGVRADGDRLALGVGAPVSLPEGGAAAFTLSRPLKQRDGLAGEIGVAVSAGPFETLFQAARGLENAAAAALIRTDGTVLVGEAAGPLLAALASEGQGGRSADSAALEAEGSIAAARKLGDVPLAVVYFVEAGAVHRPWLQRMAALAALAVMTSITLLWASRRALQDARSSSTSAVPGWRAWCAPCRSASSSPRRLGAPAAGERSGWPHSARPRRSGRRY